MISNEKYGALIMYKVKGRQMLFFFFMLIVLTSSICLFAEEENSSACPRVLSGLRKKIEKRFAENATNHSQLILKNVDPVELPLSLQWKDGKFVIDPKTFREEFASELNRIESSFKLPWKASIHQESLDVVNLKQFKNIEALESDSVLAIENINQLISRTLLFYSKSKKEWFYVYVGRERSAFEEVQSYYAALMAFHPTGISGHRGIFGSSKKPVRVFDLLAPLEGSFRNFKSQLEDYYIFIPGSFDLRQKVLEQFHPEFLRLISLGKIQVQKKSGDVFLRASSFAVDLESVLKNTYSLSITEKSINPAGVKISSAQLEKATTIMKIARDELFGINELLKKIQQSSNSYADLMQKISVQKKEESQFFNATVKIREDYYEKMSSYSTEMKSYIEALKSYESELGEARSLNLAALKSNGMEPLVIEKAMSLQQRVEYLESKKAELDSLLDALGKYLMEGIYQENISFEINWK